EVRVKVNEAGQHGIIRPVDPRRSSRRRSAGSHRSNAFVCDGDALAALHLARHAVDESSCLDIKRCCPSGGGRGEGDRERGGQMDALKVSHWRGSPVCRPRRSQVMRCALVPWVKLSGTGLWPAERISVSSPIALAAVMASSMSPASMTLWPSRVRARAAHTPA